MLPFSHQCRSSGWVAAIVIAMMALATTLTSAHSATLAERFTPRDGNGALQVDHSGWSALLSRYVVKSPDGVNRVRYAAWKRDNHPALKAYVATLEAIDVRQLGKPDQFAYWINLYNAKTIDVVLDAYPIASIKDIRLGGGLFGTLAAGPWKADVVQVSGTALSLDDIEHGILRPVFQDARIHYAVNCASIGCPNLATEAYTGATLDAQLNAAAVAYINHPRGIAVRSGDVHASSIFKWYQQDFFGSEAGVLKHARTFARPDLKDRLKAIATISQYDYDWSLNDADAL